MNSKNIFEGKEDKMRFSLMGTERINPFKKVEYEQLVLNYLKKTPLLI